MWVQPLVGEDPLEEHMQLTPVYLLGESRGQRSLKAQFIGLQRIKYDWSDLAHTQSLLNYMQSDVLVRSRHWKVKAVYFKP